MYILMQEVVDGTVPYSHSQTIVGVVGFAAAVGIGSVAWYNSKRPAGWEGKERPNVIPKINKD
ncbi:MAG: hypothetical protein AAGB19_05495 [Cyanobacteria bacterium P01_F01_bin.3]